MSATMLVPPIRMNTTGVHVRPGPGRLVAVELRKIVDTRAGFWLKVATVAITVVAVIVRLMVGDAADHTFASVVAAGVAAASPGIEGTWSDVPMLIGQSAVFLGGGMITAVAARCTQRLDRRFDLG